MNRLLPLITLIALTHLGCTNPLGDLAPVSETFCAGKTDPTIDEQCKLINNTTSISWDFLDPSQYIYNEDHIEVTNGSATLKTVDQTHSGADLEEGIQVGTSLGPDDRLTLLTKPTPDSIHVNNLLPSKSASLLGYWRFDGNFNDSSGNGNDGISFGATINSSSPKFGTGSATLNGGTDRVELPPITPANNYTIAAWAKVTVNHTGAIFSSGPTAGCSPSVKQFRISSYRPDIRIGCGGGAQTSSDSIFADKWTHIVWSIDSSSRGRIYINGKEVLSNIDVAGGNSLGTGNDLIGISYGGGNFESPFDGEIDEVALYSSALTTDEILALYNGQNSNFTELSPTWTPHWDSIVGYWKMDGNWQDSSGNGHHGTPVGDATFGDSPKVGSHQAYLGSSGDYVTVGSIDVSSFTSITMVGWFRSGTSASRDSLLSIQHSGMNDLRVGMNGQESIVFALADGSNSEYILSVNRSLADGQWHFFAAVFDGTSISLRVDDTFSDAKTASFNFATASGLSAIGTHMGDPTNITYHAHGHFDDFAIWNKPLTDSEIQLIYDRQKQKYAGHYESPVIDLGTSGSWTMLDAVTSLPFGKELVPQNSESSADYSSLSGDLSSGLIGYWPLNEKVANSVGGDDFEDLALTSINANESGGLTFDQEGVLYRSVLLDGIDDQISVGLSAFSNTHTFSIWARDTGGSTGGSGPGLIQQGTLQVPGSNEGSTLRISNSKPQFNSSDGSGNRITIRDNGTLITDGLWHHIVGVKDVNNLYLYVDGKLTSSTSITGFTASSNGTLLIGNASGIRWKGFIDEPTVWSRALTATEIQHLYRRGANRLKYQVRSCDDPDCAGEIWSGPDGTNSSYYSELHNNEDIDTVTGEPRGLTRAAALSLNFLDFPIATRPVDNRYFQYRVIMEAEDNTACSGEPCLPELTSIEVGPTGRYFGGSPVIRSSSALSSENLQSISFDVGGSCSTTYQLAPDGTTYYYYNGSEWVTAGSESVALSSSPSQISANISTMAEVFGAENLYFKAFLNSDTTQSCSINDITVTKTKR